MSIFTEGGLRGNEMRVLQRQRKLTRWALLAERVAHACWPVFVVICVGLAAMLFGLFQSLGPLGHRIGLALFALAVMAALLLAGYRFRKPELSEVDARLDEGDPRRPLATLHDSLVVGQGDAASESIWQAHINRAKAAAIALRARMPDLRLSSVDGWGLRLAAPALLVVALIGTGGNIGSRIEAVVDPASMKPSAAPGFVQREAVAEAWATPPAYTGMGTVYLEKQQTIARADGSEVAPQPVLLPEGSELTIRVTDAESLPTLSGGGLAGIETFTMLGGGLAEATGLVTASGEIVIKHGEEELARWGIEMLPDETPQIEIVGEPTASITRALELEFRATDDYGITAAWAEIAPEGHDPEQAKGLPLPVINFGLPLPITGELRDVQDQAIRDFSAHPWAGAKLKLHLKTEDGAGQIGEAEPREITLPARIFNNRLARALVEQRRELAMDYGKAIRVLDVLQAVTRRPEEIFDNTSVYLPVRIAIRRLAGAIGDDSVPEVAPDVIEFLWQAALALEDGDLSNALERLRQAQEALREALENGSEEDIRRAMEEMRAAMNDYLQQLAQQAQRNPQAQNQQQQQQQGQEMTQQDLNDMLDQMMEQAEQGLRDQAREMLSQLQQMLENMQAMQGQQQQQGPGQQAMQELQDMIQRQRDLSDQTFDEMRQRRREQQLGQAPQQQGQQGQGQEQPGFGEGQGRGDEHGQSGNQGGEGERGEGMQPNGQQQGGQGGGNLAQQQEALRQELENLSRGVGSDEAARALEEAARSMGAARDDLQQGSNSEAVRDQMEALDRLNEGAQALAEQMRQGQGDTQAQGPRRGRGQASDSEELDPFERPAQSFGALDGTSTKVPDQSLLERGRELLQELRRRAAEPSRPQLELDYLDRLMERF